MYIIPPNTPLLTFREAPISRADMISYPLVIPNPPIKNMTSRGYGGNAYPTVFNGVGTQIRPTNFPFLNLRYYFPNPSWVPWFIPTSPLPRISPVDQPSLVVQPGNVNRLGSVAMQQYLATYLSHNPSTGSQSG